MRCPRCDFENPHTVRFCAKCGAEMGPREARSAAGTLGFEHSPVLAGSTIGKYRILSELGKGGMGNVYSAQDTTLKRTVALKFLSSKLTGDPQARRQFIREAQAASALDHPSICTIYEIDETEAKQLFISMAYYQGQTLREKLDKGALDIKQVLDIAIAVATGLGKAHHEGIIHRDIKPGNIFVADDGQVKILDFGLAKLAREGAGSSGLPVGTVLYMSPEQIEGRSVDHRTDIWSLGVVIYEMISGSPPFTGRSISEVMNLIISARQKPARPVRVDIPVELEKVIDKALAKNPESRYQEIGDILADLAVIRDQVQAKMQDARPSIAVLPFADMSPQKDQEYFCEGIAEELINSLAKIHDLHVASRTSAFKYKESDLDIREIGRNLGVKTVLEGSVRKAGDRLRITAQLIDVTDGYHRWSERYDRDMQDVFAIQDEIAQSIVDALKVTLSQKEKQSIQGSSTTDVQAYDYYLRGRKFYYQFRRRSIELALQMFTMAIRHDPNYAPAYTGIADCWTYLFLYSERSEENLREADQASKKALELDPELAQAHASRGQVLSVSQKHDDAEAEFEAAIRLDPRLFEAYYLYARDCFAQGKLKKAAHLYEMASEVNPDDYQSPLLGAQIYVSLGDEPKAAATRRRGIRIVEERLKANPGEIRALYMGANGLMALGEVEKGLEWASLALTIDPEEPMTLYNVACIFSMAGHVDRALDCLEKAATAGLSQREWYEHDRDLDPLRDHPRFGALLERLK